MSRFDDADAVLDARVHMEGATLARGEGRSDDSARVYHALDDEGRSLVLSTVKVTGTLDPGEVFIQAFIVGVAAAQIAGLAWAEWFLLADELPAINLGIARSAATRVIAGGHPLDGHGG